MYRHILNVSIAAIGLIATFHSVGKFMFFLSDPNRQENVAEENSIPKSLLIDMLLISTFILQHTFMVLPSIKQFMSKYGLDVISRSVYTILSSCLLLLLIKYWQTVAQVRLWNLNTDNYFVWLFFAAVHTFAWSVIYTGCLLMDISELLGIKQVYYNLRKMSDPIEFKSSELQRLYGHTRHPSFSALIVIFWCYPTMTLDRLVLATIMTVYMFLAWKTDKYDLKYHEAQYMKKSQELQYMK